MKRITCLLLCFLLCMSGSAAAYSDLEDSPYQEAADVLSKLFIVQGYEDGTFVPDSPISRAEFTAYVVRMLGLEAVTGSAAAGGQTYSDVPGDHWAAGHIAIAASMGLVHGMGDGTFLPDQTVTVVQAAKIVMCALGYQPLAEAAGGFPTGYLIAGSNAGLLDSLSGIRSEDALLRGQAAQMIFNVLEEPIYETNFNGYTELTEKNVLDAYLNVEKKSGIVVANEYTSLTDTTALRRGYVRIQAADGSVGMYDAGVAASMDILGCAVEYYTYEADDKEDEILWISPIRFEEQLLTLSSEDVADTATLAQFVYYQNGRQKTASFDEDASVIYNGRLYPAAAGELPKPETGELRLIDNNRDGRYDVLQILDYRNYVVEQVNEGQSSIAVKKNGYGIYTIKAESDASNRIRFIKDGAEIAITDLRPDDVITVTESQDAFVKLIVVGGETIDGQVEECWETNQHDCYVRLDNGEEYAVSKALDRALEVGDEAKFYLAHGRIIYADYTASVLENYGYVLGVSSARGLLGGHQMRILTKDNEKKVYDLANRVRIENSNGTTVSYLNSDAALYKVLQDMVNELVITDVNADDKISKIALPFDFTLTSDYVGYAEDLFSKDKSAELYYKAINPPTLGGQYMLTDETIVFNVATEIPGGGQADEEDFYAGDYNIFGKDRYYIVDIYNATPNKKAKAVVIRKDTSTEANLPWNNPCLLVDKVTSALDADGEQVYKIRGILNGEEVSETLEHEEVKDVNTGKLALGLIERGTVMQIQKNIDGEIENVRVLYTPSDASYRKEQAWSGSEVNVDLYTIYGTVTYKEPDVMSVSTDGGITAKPFAIGDAKVYRYSERLKKVEVVSYDEIEASLHSPEGASRVFMRAYRNTVGEIIIYED